MKKLYFKIILLISLFSITTIFSQTITLVDFGSSSQNNIFELDGWDQVLLSNEMSYSSGSVDGVILTDGFEEFTDFMGVLGSERTFNLGERIVVTWYNNSDEVIFFSSRISFDDSDNPNGGSSEGNWFTMRSFDDYRETLLELQPNSIGKTAFNITDYGVHKSDGNYSLININLAIEWGQSDYKQYLTCDKIELYNDADVEPPSAPTNLSGEILSDSKIELSWDIPDDNVGVVEYLIYNGNKVEGYSKENSFTCVFLEPETSYNFSVTALDKNRNESTKSETITLTTYKYSHSNELINPSGFNYLGAFTFPEDFAWGGEAIAYNVNGDPTAEDNFTGSLFATNLNQPENGLVGEVSIPLPIISTSKNIEDLNEAQIIQQPTNIRPDNINSWEYVDIWRTGLEYYPTENMLYSSWSIHYTVSGEKHATLSRCKANDLANSEKEGALYLGSPTELPNEAMMCDYLFYINDESIGSSLNNHLVTGRFRDGGLSGLGPTMYAFPSFSIVSSPNVPFQTLLEYGSVEGTDNYNYPNSIDGYKHSDVWRDAAYLLHDNQKAFMIIGNKALGNNWYGYKGENMLHEWIAYDIPYPDFYATDPDGKSWMSHEFMPMAIFYDPNDIASVADGSIESYTPQPYAALRFDENIFFSEANEIRSAAYDQENGLLYAAEFDLKHDGAIIIHVWQIETIVDVKQTQHPSKFELCQNYPNPFNPTTIIEYSIPQMKMGSIPRVLLKVYDLLGREVATLVNQKHSPGKYSITFDASYLTSGVYLYQLKAGRFIQTKKMVLIK